jgi:hypothetical protein
MNHKIITLLILTCSSLSNCMEQHISTDIQRELLNTSVLSAATLHEAIHPIKTFYLSCKKFNKFIEQEHLSLIKKLSIKFELSNEYAASKLPTLIASNILMKQLGFSAMCGTDIRTRITPEQERHIKKCNIDLDFTYGDNCETQLIEACARSTTSTYSYDIGKPFVAAWLVKNGADINKSDRQGTTAPFHAIARWDDSDKQLIEYFWNHPQFRVNEIGYQRGRTTLISYLAKYLPSKESAGYESHYSRKRSFFFRLIQGLCNRGADPELKPHYNDQTYKSALDRAIEKNDQELLAILQEAIAKKHAQVK